VDVFRASVKASGAGGPGVSVPNALRTTAREAQGPEIGEYEEGD
jgi:hypothetical protein